MKYDKKNVDSDSLFNAKLKFVLPEEYYSFSCNPRLEDIVKTFIHQYEPERDDYQVSPFDTPILDRSPTPTYDMHMYWAKKPHGAIEKYIGHFTKPNDVILDPLCGTGGAGSVALRLGRKAVLIDISPAATFIAKHLVTQVDPRQVKDAFEQLYAIILKEMNWLYETRCDRCDGPAITAYVVHSQVYQCVKCYSNIPIFDCTDGRHCPNCHEKISTRTERLGYVPVEASYICLNGCRPERDRRKYNDSVVKKKQYFNQYDLGKIVEIKNNSIPYWYPTDPFPKEWISWRPNLGEAGDVSGFFTKRNLWASALIVDALDRIENTQYKSWLMFTFTATLMNISKKAQHLEEGGGYIPGNYTFPPMIKERNALNSYKSVADKVLKGVAYIFNSFCSQDVVISTQSALDISGIPTSSIDYIFTDPPYSDKVPFGEFNFLWEVWLRKGLSWKDEEIIVNKKIGKGYDTWKTMMVRVIEECYRVLKPGRWMSVCYHDSAEGSWELLQDAFSEVGFIADNSRSVLSIERDLKSFKQRTTNNVQMRDLVINFRKPHPNEDRSCFGTALSESESEETFREKAISIIHTCLKRRPGLSKDRIFDELVSHMVRRGLMETHNFDHLLRLIAEPAGDQQDKWFLKEKEEIDLDSAESTREDAAANTIKALIGRWIDQHPESDGMRYPDIYEQYLYLVNDKPRRQLQELMVDYFYKTDSGAYRLPFNDEEEIFKKEVREKGTYRKIKRYITYLEQGVAIPEKERSNDATISEWIRHCKRSGLYEQGKLLYEHGGLNLDNLSEEAQVNVEEDYQTCIRMLNRAFNLKKEQSRRF